MNFEATRVRLFVLILAPLHKEYGTTFGSVRFDKDNEASIIFIILYNSNFTKSCQSFFSRIIQDNLMILRKHFQSLQIVMVFWEKVKTHFLALYLIKSLFILLVDSNELSSEVGNAYTEIDPRASTKHKESYFSKPGTGVIVSIFILLKSVIFLEGFLFL